MTNSFDHIKNLILRLAATAVIICLCAQPAFAKNQAKIFVVKSRDISSYNQALEGFKQLVAPEWSLTEYDLQGTLKNSGEMLTRLNEAAPDLVVAVGAKALTAVTQSKISLPIVFCAAINITKDELANTNVTGISLTVSPKEQLDILTSISPKIKTIGVLLRDKNSENLFKELTAFANKYNLTVIPIAMENEKEIPQKLRSAINKIDALWMLDDAYIHTKETLEFVIGTTLENNMTFMATSEVFVEIGATVSLSPSFFDNGRQTAKLVKKILDQDLTPRDIPISYHENPDLVINLKMAKKIGLDVPLELINKAKVVYK